MQQSEVQVCSYPSLSAAAENTAAAANAAAAAANSAAAAGRPSCMSTGK